MSRVLRIALLASFLAAPAAAQDVLLQLRPGPGDTLRLTMEQQSEMTGTRRDAAGGTSTSTGVISTLKVYSRVIVESAAPGGATVLAVVDSMLISSTDPHAATTAGAAPQRVRPPGEVRLRVTPSGTVQVPGAAGDARADADLLSLIPASFPREPVRVGESWERTVSLPGATISGASIGVLHATFRLDSLARGGRLAYISMRGEVRPDTVPPRAFMRSRVERGTLDGTMVLDRRRGWITESWYALLVHTTVASSSDTQGPMRFQLRVTQRVRTMDKR